jgi:hypothetical protein
MRQRPTVNHQFQNKAKFALLAVNNVYTNLPATAFQLSDGTWVMPTVPVADLGIWKEWLGSVRMERLGRANLVLFVEEASHNPEIVDEVHQRLDKTLSDLFYMLHLRPGIEVAEGADLLWGSSVGGVPGIRHMSQMPKFHQSKGWRRAPITADWLEEGLIFRAGVTAMDADRNLFRRVVRGLVTLFKGMQETRQDRLHQFVRSLEGLILPDIGSTQKQFAHRCQTFARAGDDTRTLLLEAFEMRSDTEHLNPWDEAVQSYPAEQREDVCWHRTRQVEHLACDAYSRLLRDAALRTRFRTETEMAAFWKLPDDQRQTIWGKPLDVTLEPLVQNYDQWERATS